MNKLIVISGPSGVGKGTLVKEVLRADSSLVKSVSCTTRAPREGERDGREYFFLSREEFLRRAALGDFLEYDEHFGNFYGTPRSFVEEVLRTKSVILEIDVVGGLNCKRLLPGRCVLIFVAPPSLEALEARLSGRGSETEEEQSERLRRVRYELGQEEKYDYIVVNDDLNTAANEILGIIGGETRGGMTPKE